MANDEDDLRLNTLNRFAKKSPRLHLEEYSHCEVPAGCGGVVLRWTDPSEAVAGIVLVAVAGRLRGHLDGKPLESGRALLGAGEHVLALAIERTEPTPPLPPDPGGLLHLGAPETALSGASLFAAAVAHDAGRDEGRRALPGAATSGDGTWRAVTQHVDGWEAPAFDDSAWPALAAAPAGTFERLPPADALLWRLRDLARAGASLLVLPEGEARLWVRKRFVVETAS